MHGTTRRELILSAAVAAAAFGIDGRLAMSAPAPRPKTPDPAPDFHRFRVGAAKRTALYDGIWQKSHDPAYFKNASVDQTKQALAAARLPTCFILIPIATLLVNVKGKLTLCGAGGGGQVQAFSPQSVFVSGKMIANMKAAGIDPGRIETILILHFHPDHIFGLLTSRANAPVFPNAEIIVPAAEYKWWTGPSLIGRLPDARRPLSRRIQSVIPKWKHVLPFEGEDEVVPGMRFVAAPSHTPGHTAFHLSSGKQGEIIWGYRDTGRNITARKRAKHELILHRSAQARLSRLGRMGELAAALAHEINQPLMAASTYSRLVVGALGSGPASSEMAREAAYKAADQIERAAEVVRRLRNLIRLGRIETEPVSLPHIVRRSLSLLQPEIERHRIKVSEEIAPELPPVIADALQIEQVLMNLVRNSIEAISGAGTSGGTLTIEAARAQPGLAEISVRDTGPGFRAGQAAGPTPPLTTTKADGLGLGLSLCRSIIKAHGGKLWIDASRPGAVVHFTLPFSEQT